MAGLSAGRPPRSWSRRQRRFCRSRRGGIPHSRSDNAAGTEPRPLSLRSLLLSEHKRRSLHLSRASQRSKVTEGDSEFHESEMKEEDQEQWKLSMDDLPEDVVVIIIASLDPMGLAMVACVNKRLKDMAMSDRMWRPWAGFFLTTAAIQRLEDEFQGQSSSPSQSQNKYFCAVKSAVLGELIHGEYMASKESVFCTAEYA